MDSRDWDRRYEESGYLWSVEPNRFLVAEVADLPAGRALDLGCGEGRNAVWLAERGWEVTAVDFSSVGLEKASRLAEHRGVEVRWVPADLRTYRPERSAFDLVLVFYLHLPAEELEAVLGKAVAALAPGGVLVVVGHDVSNLVEGHGGPGDPGLLYTPERIAAHLDELVVERAERVHRTVEIEEGEARAVDTLVRARRPR